jgi:NADPH:quinone reductase
MRAIGIRGFGGLEVLEALAVEPSMPSPGQARVRVAFCGVNWIDVHVRRGAFLGRRSGAQEWPLILGFEGAGIVEALGEGVVGLAVCDQVAWCGVPGAHAELAIVPAWRLVPVPRTMPLDIACALQLDGVLAHALTVSVFPIRSGDRVLIQPGIDPVALLLIQIAKAQGATVLTTVATASDVSAPRAAGADHVIALEARTAAAEIRAATGGQGCHVVYDGLGRDTISLSLASCRRRGMVVLYGEHAGPVEEIKPVDLAAAGSLYLTRPHLTDFLQDAAEIQNRTLGLFEAWQSDRLKVGIGRILPLEAAREGHLALESGVAAGKILLRV